MLMLAFVSRLDKQSILIIRIHDYNFSYLIPTLTFVSRLDQQSNPTCIKFIIHHNICIHSFQNLHPSFNIHIHYPSCIDNCAYLMLYLNPTFINNYIHPLTYILNIRINYLTFISSLDQQSNPNCIQFMKKSSILISILRSNL